jgi:hypothetical protein
VVGIVSPSGDRDRVLGTAELLDRGGERFGFTSGDADPGALS